MIIRQLIIVSYVNLSLWERFLWLKIQSAVRFLPGCKSGFLEKRVKSMSKQAKYGRGGGECLGLYGKIKAKWAINKQWGCEMDSSGSWSLERDSRYVGFRKCRVFMKRMSNCQLLKVGSVLAFECCSNEKLQPTRYGTSDVAYFTSTSRHSQNSVCTIRP